MPRPQAAAFALFAVALAVLGVVAASAAPSPHESSRMALSAATGAGVLHVRARRLYHAPGGALMETRLTELWLDRATGDARHEERGYGSGFHSVQVRRGLTRTTYLPREGVVERHVAADGRAPFLRSVEERALGYANDLRRGALRPLGGGTLDNRAVVVVQRAVDGEGFDTVRAWVDRETGLPLKEVAYRTRWGILREVETERIEYLAMERLERGDLPAGLFAVSPAPSARESTHRYLTPAAAAQLRDFPVYWLGPEHGGLPLHGITRDEPGAGGGVSVAVVYAHPYDRRGEQPPGELAIVQRAPLTGAERRALPPGEAVSVRGWAAVLRRHGPAVQLELTLGGTFVTLGGDDAGRVLRAAAELRRLNGAAGAPPEGYRGERRAETLTLDASDGQAGMSAPLSRLVVGRTFLPAGVSPSSSPAAVRFPIRGPT